jgi:hypothetical protein
MEGTVAVLIEIKRQHKRSNQLLLNLPGTIRDGPHDLGVPNHPVRQLGLPLTAEGHARAAPHPTQANPQLIREKAAEGEAEG